ncbi:FecR domain-containing protein [Cupriavidus plantarum]|uniref:FecR domain-containing protein n=1 Tax=Cupriavidus plantarum TaxID=942865 RepID=UPI0015CC78CC|nr:FecR domain-containing protein [Cupriavidus plantarum]NYI02289.1 transmembrane sensor [Cupriavidus plantarum]
MKPPSYPAQSTWYQATSDAASIPPHIAEQALEWLVELQDAEVSPEVVASWRQWRAAHPDHERAWRRIESVQGRLQPLATPATAGIARAALMPTASRTRRHALKAVAVLLVAGGVTWRAREPSGWRAWTADYRTGVGERRKVVLSDGTTLMLNTASAVDILFDATERRVRLLAGEILITTAPDREPVPRPFLVETAFGTARALGTQYVMRHHAHGTGVAVYTGAVEIRPRENPARKLVLQSGYSASYTAQTITVPEVASRAGMAWAEGFIVARSMRLGDFIAELGRYSRKTLSCDPALRDVLVSGSFPVDDVAKVLDTLGTTLNVRQQTVSRFWGGDEIRLVPPGAPTTR